MTATIIVEPSRSAGGDARRLLDNDKRRNWQTELALHILLSRLIPSADNRIELYVLSGLTRRPGTMLQLLAQPMQKWPKSIVQGAPDLILCKQRESLLVEYPMIERIQPRLFPRPPLLITESREDFDQVRNALEREIQPQGIIEQMYVNDLAYLRLGNSAPSALQGHDRQFGISNRTQRVIKQLLREPGELFNRDDEFEDLALRWFTDPKAKREVTELLGKFRLDEIAIEAEAIRECSQYLEQLDRMLRSLEARRDRALALVTEYRVNFAHQLRELC